MNAFAEEMIQSITAAQDSLRTARDEGDDFLVDIREAELASLAQIAVDHDLAVPQLRTA